MLTRKDLQGAWKLASGVINVVTIALVGITLLFWVFAPWVVQNVIYVLAPGTNIGQLDLTVRLLRIMLPTVVIFGVSGLLMGILNAHQHFLIPALAPSLYSLGIISGALLWHKTVGVESLAYGTLIGATLHLLVQVPSLFKLKDRAYTLHEGLYNPYVRRVVLLMLPRLVGAGVVQLNFVVNTMIALGLEAGSTAALGFAFILFMMPQRMIAQSAGIASLPTLSAQAELKQFDAMRTTLSSILRGILLLSIPSTVGLILIRYPLVQVLLERGEFNARSTAMVAWGLMWYSAGLVGHCLVEVLSRAFYAAARHQNPSGGGHWRNGAQYRAFFLAPRLVPLNGPIRFGRLSPRKFAGNGHRKCHFDPDIKETPGRVIGSVDFGWYLEGANWDGLHGGGYPDGDSRFCRQAANYLARRVLAGVLVYGVAMYLFKVPELRRVLKAVKRKLGRLG